MLRKHSITAMILCVILALTPVFSSAQSDATATPSPNRSARDALLDRYSSQADVIESATDNETRINPDTLITNRGKDAPVILVYYADEWDIAIEELELLDVIDSGGNLVFFEDLAFFEGQGSFFTELAAGSPHSNIVIAGELSFTTDNTETIETCTLLARVSTNDAGFVINQTQMGLSNTNEFFYVDSIESSDDMYFDFMDDEVNLNETHHVLGILVDDTLTLFLNGEEVFRSAPIHSREGIYGIGLTGGMRGSRCEGRNIWVYNLDG